MDSTKRTFLLLDSDDRFRRVIQTAAESYAARVIQATSLAEAELELPLKSVNHPNVPDLIIMDTQLKDGDGMAWLKQRRDAGLKSPVFVIASGCHTTQDYVKLKSELGVAVFMHKPVSVGLLAKCFSDFFNEAPDAAKKAHKPDDGPDIDEIEREIRALSAEYVRELPERFEFLKRQVKDLKVGIGESSTAKNEAHKIKGTASSYGAHKIGEQAVIIDDCLRQVSMSPAQNVPADLWKRLETALEEALRLSLEAVAEANAHAAVPAVYDERAALNAIGLPLHGGHNIVIVDDDPDFTRRVSLVLGYEDMLVYSFNDAKDLTTVLADLQPDLLILDLNMPDVDGFEVCKRLRLDARFKHLPIVFLTAQTGWETRVAAFDAGGDDYIPKPVVNQELIARIRFRAEKSRLQEEMQSQTTINQLLWRAMYLLLVQGHHNSAAESMSGSSKSG